MGNLFEPFYRFTMKIAALIVLCLFLLILTNEIYFFSQKNNENESRYQKVKMEFEQAQAGLEKMQADLNYYANPENLEKEIRARFNYRLVGEKMFIIIPDASSTKK